MIDSGIYVNKKSWLLMLVNNDENINNRYGENVPVGFEIEGTKINSTDYFKVNLTENMLFIHSDVSAWNLINTYMIFKLNDENYWKKFIDDARSYIKTHNLEN